MESIMNIEIGETLTWTDSEEYEGHTNVITYTPLKKLTNGNYLCEYHNSHSAGDFYKDEMTVDALLKFPTVGYTKPVYKH
jgi:hypothetical protein